MLDLHVHVWPHTPGTPTPTLDQLARYCERAERVGVTQIAITEHSHRFGRILDGVIPHWDRPLRGPVAEATARVLETEGRADLDDYVAALTAAQEAGLPLLVGLEVDYLPGAVEAMRAVIDEYPFDVLLGSVHWLDEWLFDAYDNEAFAGRWVERDVDDVFAQYVDHVLALVESGIADVLAHVDVIKVAGHVAGRLEEHEARLVDGLADAGVVVELSSAGLRKPVADTYPSANLLDELLAAGVGLTTASDAHTVGQVGSGFDVLRRELRAREVTELTTFRRRERRPYPLTPR